MRKRIILFVFSVAGILLSGCASTVSPQGSSVDNLKVEEEKRIIFPPYEGTERKIQVVEIRIPKEDIERYPELSNLRVGHGMADILYTTLDNTNRFIFVEGREEMKRRILNEWEDTESGIIAGSREFTLLPADFLVYATLFNFDECLRNEKIGLTKELVCITSVGIQVRIVKVTTRELILGSSDPRARECTYINIKNLPFLGSTLTAFEKSAVYDATVKATRCAVFEALKRFDRKGW
jgi:curli biogenesis system outer membrane secretion channel CsgG